jgi:hypothetical protein
MDVAGESLLYDKFMLYIWKARVVSMHRHLSIAVISALILLLVTLVACGTIPPASPAPVVVILLGTPVGANDQVTLAALLTQEQNNTDFQAAATAEIMRANAQATLNSANATLNAVQTQNQNNANLVAAQIAATAQIVRANAQATLVAAGSTQSAALTQDAMRQTQTQYELQVTQAAGTQSADAILVQQYKNDLASGTQTAVANNIATQTQVAVVTAQFYADQSRQVSAQRQVPLTFLLVWCLPAFLVLAAVVVIWGIWRGIRIQQANQRILDNPIEKLPPPERPQQDDSSVYSDSDIIDSHFKLTKPVDQSRRWIDEVKRKLLSSDKKDEDDHTDD